MLILASKIQIVNLKRFINDFWILNILIFQKKAGFLSNFTVKSTMF